MVEVNDSGSPLKMYILVLRDIPLGVAMVSVAHASLAGWLKWEDDLTTQLWQQNSFRKVVCRVSAAQLEKAKREAPDHLVITESEIGDVPVCAVFKPLWGWPKIFRSLRLYTGKTLEFSL